MALFFVRAISGVGAYYLFLPESLNSIDSCLAELAKIGTLWCNDLVIEWPGVIRKIYPNAVAVWGFHKHDIINWSAVGWLVGPALLGAPLGTWLALEMPDATFQKVLAFLMVGITLLTLWQSPVVAEDRQLHFNFFRRLVRASGFFIVGVYGGFVQAGVGFLLLSMTPYLGLDLLRGNAVKVLTVWLLTILSLGLFVWQDKVHWEFGCALGVGSALGAWLGVRLSIAQGHAWIRQVVMMAVSGFAIHLWMTA